jgi:hypothetical protein
MLANNIRPPQKIHPAGTNEANSNMQAKTHKHLFIF